MNNPKSRTIKQNIKANSFVASTKRENLSLKTPNKKNTLRKSNLTPSENIAKMQTTTKIHKTKTMIKEKF